MESFAQRLRNAMQALGMKSIELHERTGISKATISEYLSGRIDSQGILRNLIKIFENP